ncbi:MAG TPA: zinc-ribbon domain-containing protein [Polyangiaceae bacterium]
MNISCISCPARYGVPDEKLAGKRVRITCKRCGAVLLVDGSVNPPRVTSGADAGPSVAPVPRASLPPLSSPPSSVKQAVEFLVVMPDGRQESADVAQIVRLYRDQRIDAEALVWREGMDEWATLWDAEEIASAFRRMGYARPSQPAAPPSSQPAQASYDDEGDASTHVAPSSHPPGAGDFDDDEATSIVHSSRLGLDALLPSYARAEDEAATGVVPSPVDYSLPPAPEPSPDPRAARREPAARARTRGNGRGNQQDPNLDLFTAQARRAAEQELTPAAEDDGARLTGARGENSVLFSLDQLVKQEQQKQRPVVMPLRARTDESVLVDSSPSLESGGAGAPLVAPDFTAPVSAPPPQLAAFDAGELAYPAPKKRGWLAPVLLIVVVGGLAGAWFSGKLQPILVAAGVPIPAPASTSTGPEPSASPARSAEPAPSEAATAEPAASVPPSASVAASAAPSAAAPATLGATRPAAPRSSAASTAPREAETAPPKDEAKPAAGGAEFDTASAKTALTAAAANAGSCKEAGGPTGTGKVSITFAPSGRPTSVAVTGDLAGTTVGSCVAKLFRAARVPPFSGDPVSVSKAFSVQ